ncbi:MAG: PilN domain-containing protein [Cyanobacteria bacterium P01_H01_bin.130]
MYSLNVNFLKDRPEFQGGGKPAAAKKQAKKGISLDGQTPLYLGVAGALAALGIVGGAFLYLNFEMNKLESQQLTLDDELSDLQAQINEAERAQAETGIIRKQTQALVGVFDQIRAWSAILGDIRDRLPVGVQVQTMQEEAPDLPRTTAQPAEGDALPPPPKKKITIAGNASSVDAIGEFLLLLRQSPFLDRDATKLIKTEYQDNPANVEIPRDGEEVAFEELPEGLSYTVVNPAELEAVSAELDNLPQVVEFSIETAYTDSTAEDLIQELDRNGAAGLVVRLEAIRDIMARGNITPAVEPIPTPSPTESP